jgi:hypothetical protein
LRLPAQQGLTRRAIVFKRVASVAAVVVTLVAVPAFAGARPHAKSHTVKLSGLIDTLSSTGAVGVPGTKETDSGILNGTVSGRSVGPAAFYQTVTWGSRLTLAGKGRAFNTLGSLAFKVTAKFTVNSNSTESYSGKFTITGGTGLYRNAHGLVQISGIAPTPSDDDGATIRLTGKITY